MLVNRENEAPSDSDVRRAIINVAAGAFAGAASRTFTSPLDVIKIRFQVQLEPTSSWALAHGSFSANSKYTGIVQATRDIFREEGLPGFWRGNVPALLMVMPYTSIQFAVLQKFKQIATGSSKKDDHLHLSPFLSYISGSVAGCAATVGSYPFDLVRTILASQGEPKVYPNMRSVFVEVIRARGLRGLYSGLSPTLVEIIPYAGLQFGTYDTFRRWMVAWNQFRYPYSVSTGGGDGLSSFQIFLCGLLAGATAKLVCHPLDVVKKRFQVVGLQRDPKYGARFGVEHPPYKNLFDGCWKILQSEGWAGLYKGIVPSLIKSAPAGAITFVAYEFSAVWLDSHWT